MQTDDEAVWVQRCLAGDSSAFEPLAQRYHRPLFNLAARLLGNREDALMPPRTPSSRRMRNLRSFNQGQRFSSWIYQILRNDCLNTLRSRRPSSPLPEDLTASGSPSNALEQNARQAAVQAALMTLTDDQREVVLLRH